MHRSMRRPISAENTYSPLKAGAGNPIYRLKRTRARSAQVVGQPINDGFSGVFSVWRFSCFVISFIFFGVFLLVSNFVYISIFFTDFELCFDSKF
jgi:hypothetical protein